MMGDDPLKCPKCRRYVDDETDDLDHRDSCPWADLTFDSFRDVVRGERAV